MRKRLDDVQQALQNRKQIDRAKGLLMEKRGLSEADAYAALRQQAMKQGVKLAEVARRIVPWPICWDESMSQAELPVLRAAYMPLIDCAPLVAA